MISNFFRQLIYVPFVNILVALIVWLPGHSSALAIIVFTLALRFILLIPSRKALESQKKITALQPEINEVREKYKADQQEQARALMALYEKNDISPFGSCLPLLIQLPILLILYHILQEGFTADTLTVLYPFVPRPEFINNNFFGIDLSSPDSTYILPVLAAGLQFLQTLAAMAVSRKKGIKMPGQNMILIFPLMTLFIANKINAGAVLYWVTTTIFGIFQQIAVNRGRTEIVHASDIKLPPHEHTPDKAPAAIAPTTDTSSASKETAKKGKKGVTVTIRKPKK